MDKLRRVLSGQDEGNNEGDTEEQGGRESPVLQWGSRLRFFLVFFFIGAFFCVLATFMLWIPGFGLIVFVVFYTIGNVSALISPVFLIGPCQQLKSMCAKERALATTLLFTCLALTLCSAFWWKNFTVALIFCLLQVLAFVWYGLSYVPYTRDFILKCCSIFCC